MSAAGEIVLLRDLARRCHNGAADPYQEFYDLGMSPLLDRLADALERRLPPPPECDHPGIGHEGWSPTGICPSCGKCKFIGHGPLCGDCYDQQAPR